MFTCANTRKPYAVSTWWFFDKQFGLFMIANIKITNQNA